MTLRTPNLDDRNFEDLVREATQKIRQQVADWDASPGNPGMVLVDAFAYLTDVMIYRINRLPEKAYIEFLRLLGVRLMSPTAAAATLTFRRGKPGEDEIEIPRGTRVTVQSWSGDGPAPVFHTARRAVLSPGSDTAQVSAYHYEPVDGELLGVGTGRPGQSYVVRMPPIVASPGSRNPSLIVGVEARPEEMDEARLPGRKLGGKDYRIWTEVEHYGERPADRFVYKVDHAEGRITFAPSARLGGAAEASTLAEAPLEGREIRAWYWRGGGPSGNLALDSLVKLLPPAPPGVEVTNARPAVGGQAAETVPNAIRRGPEEFSLQQRAVTASDYERLALNARGLVTRAKAFTKRMLWDHATPGTVEVHLVPAILRDWQPGQAVDVARLAEFSNPEALEPIRATFRRHRPLGTRVETHWASSKTVTVKARVVVHAEENRETVRSRILTRLHDLINPLPTPAYPSGWDFGRPLYVFQIHDVGSREPGVLRVEDVSLVVDEAPSEDVSWVSRDPYQVDREGRNTWYAGAGSTFYRSVNDAEGWERTWTFPGQTVLRVDPCPREWGAFSGLLALVTHQTSKREDGSKDSLVYVSRDCGSTWERIAEFEFEVRDFAWLARGGEVRLLLAGNDGLRELGVLPRTPPNVVAIGPASGDGVLKGFHAVAAGRNPRGEIHVVVAARELGGVWLSDRAGQSGSFESIGLEGEDVRVLECQREGDRTRFWAGLTVPGPQPGEGCRSWNFTEGVPSDRWRIWKTGWTGGSCRALAFEGSRVFAATYRRGVVSLPRTLSQEEWEVPPFTSGLPIAQEKLLKPVRSIAVDPSGSRPFILAAGPGGIHASRDGGHGFRPTSRREFEQRVTIPETWTFCSGRHEIEVRHEQEEE